MADYVPPEEMAEIVKEVISLSDCDDCNDSLSHEGKVEDIELDPGNPNDFKKFLKHVATVHVEGGIADHLVHLDDWLIADVVPGHVVAVEL